jgi:8-amino-7-oxononanoate synthase
VHLDQLPGTFFGPSNLVELVRHRAKFQPDGVAFVYLVDGENEQIQLTYGELDRQARAIGAWLESLDLAGQRALLLYPPGLEFVAAFIGCLYAGVVAVPVYPPRRNRSIFRIQSVANDAGARVALTTDVVLKRVEPVIDSTPSLKELKWLATCHVPEGMEGNWQPPDIHADTLAFLQYTSGSTGTPKGVMLNHANLVHNSALIAHAFEHTRSGTGVFWLPSYHDMGLIGGILQPLYVGRPNILMSPMSFLQKPVRWLSAITRFRATTSGGPNFAYDLCVRNITPEQRKNLDLSSWKVAFNGAEPVRAETIQRFIEVFAACGFRPQAFYPCFGMAETTLIVSGGFVEKPPVIRWFDAASLAAHKVVARDCGAEGARALVGCGETLPDQKIVIADPETMTTCPPDQIGEIWASGPSIAQGYWGQPEATERTFQACLKDTGEGPFLRTGDLGFLQEGELYVTGRIKDLIIVHGMNLYPQDIEQTVSHCHPRLRPDTGAAFTIDSDGRERLVIVYELERRTQGDLAEVFSAIRRAVSAEHEIQVEAIVLIKAGSIPKTSSGKIQRHACRNGFLAGSLEIVGQWQISEHEAAPPAPKERASEAAGLPGPAPQKAAAAPQDEPLARHAAGVAAGANAAAVSPAAAAPPAAAVAEPAAASGGNGAGAKTAGNGKTKGVAELVLQEVRKIARERAANITLDSSIVELGLDSLERMEVLAALEERFGGRFPEEILPDLITSRNVVEAVEKYLGKEPRLPTEQAAGKPLSPECYRIEQFPEYVKLRESLDRLQITGVGNPFFTVHQGVTADRTVIEGRELINFSSYNYVGMSGDPVVTKAAQEAARRYGTSVSASRLVSGEKPVHRDLERAIARFLGTENSIVFVGGHATNETVIGHLLGPGDLIVHDALAHNSILQGAILSGARRRSFAHNQPRAADEILEQYRGEYRRVLIVIEGVYSMDGDIANLPKFIELRKRHKTLLMIDEAHSAGTLGATGRGIGEHFGADRRSVDVWMGTLSKSFGSCGGYVAGSQALVEYLKYTAPGFVFSVGMTPPSAAAALASIQLLEAEPQRVKQLQERARLFLTLARARNLNTGMSKDSPLVPVILGNSVHCLQLSQAMFARGVNVQPILYPAVEEKAARLRFFITCKHTEEQIRYTVDMMAEELEKILSRSLVETSTR